MRRGDGGVARVGTCVGPLGSDARPDICVMSESRCRQDMSLAGPRRSRLDRHRDWASASLAGTEAFPLPKDPSCGHRGTASLQERHRCCSLRRRRSRPLVPRDGILAHHLLPAAVPLGTAVLVPSCLRVFDVMVRVVGAGSGVWYSRPRLNPRSGCLNISVFREEKSETTRA